MSQITPALIDAAEELGKAAALELLDDGLTPDEALDLVAAALDAVLPLRALLPPPLGTLAEASDGPAIRAALAAITKAVQPNPERLERRAEKAAQRGHFVVAARRRARAAKLRG